MQLTAKAIGSTASYTCNQGFKLVGSSRRTCQPNGRWSPRVPFCKSKNRYCMYCNYTSSLLEEVSIKCKHLVAPAYSSVHTSSGTNIGSIATYSCFPGYTLIGVSIIKCTASGNWSPSVPYCILNEH